MKDHSHASDSELVRELTTTRGALQDALRIGETLQARVDRALELTALLPEQPLRAELSAVLEGRG